jgi:peptidoglycan/xylan/chitin deacetylase (PgdA/CDA1 family)
MIPAGDSTPGPPVATIALMYHALGVFTIEQPGADPHYAVDPPRFERQLVLCARLHGAVVSARDWLAGAPGIIFTFDDGHETNHRVAFPTLRAAGAGADFFVNPAQVGGAGFVSWSDLREMAEAGLSIQSHGLDHRYYLTSLSPARLREELRRSRLEIEDHVGRPVTLLVPPGGRSPRDLEQVAQEVGYTHVLGSRPALIRRDGGRTLGRFAVTAGLGLPAFESLVRGGRARRLAQARYATLDLAKRLLGDERYAALRRRLLGTAPI